MYTYLFVSVIYNEICTKQYNLQVIHTCMVAKLHEINYIFFIHDKNTKK